MKINFDGAFRDISRIINARAKAPEGDTASFSSLLGSVAPDRPQNPVTPEGSKELPTLESRSKPVDSGPMARYNFSPPAPEEPSLEPFLSPEHDSNSVKAPSASVKTPSLVEAKRLPAEGALFSRAPEVQRLVNDAGMRLGVDPALGEAVVAAESSFNPQAVSSDGHNSKGLFQLLDSTGKDLHARLDLDGRYDPFNPKLNVELGVNYLRYLHEIFSNPTPLPNDLTTVAAANSSSLEKLAVASFNAGEGRVASAQARAKHAGKNPAEYDQVAPYLPESTQDYVKKVLSYRDEIGAKSIG